MGIVTLKSALNVLWGSTFQILEEVKVTLFPAGVSRMAMRVGN
jgi:hypothetical protein